MPYLEIVNVQGSVFIVADLAVYADATSAIKASVNGIIKLDMSFFFLQGRKLGSLISI
jgi:hypothetical protein